MHLMAAALVVSVGIALSCVLPWVVPVIRTHSKRLMMVGTVILLGFVFFDLIPETIEEGGYGALGLMLASWAFFSGLHVFMGKGHDHHGHKDGGGHEGHAHQHHGLTSLLMSMAIHCFSGGMMLVTSYDVSAAMASSVLVSLLAHKGFEAVSVSALLVERTKSKAQLLGCVGFYALSFPAGVVTTIGLERAFRDSFSHEAVELFAMNATAVAIGSLFGCLVHDFLLPSLAELRRAAVRTA